VAFKLAEAVVDIKANDRDLDAKLAGAKGKLGKFFDSVKSMAVPLAGVIGAAVVAKLTQYIGDAAKSAGDLNETLSKTEVVFGDASSAVVKFADDMQATYGSARTEVLNAASDLGLVGKAIGLSKAEAAAFSIQLAKLADDAASFYNTGLEDALDRIKAALRGESDPIEKFGVMLNEAAVNTEVLRLGLAKSKGEITDSMKVQARYNLIVKGLTDATGDHARTQGSFNNQLKEFQGRLSTLGQSIGQIVLPFFNKMLQIINPIIQAIDSLVNKIKEVPAAMAALTGGGVQYGSQLAMGTPAVAAKAAPKAAAAAALPGDAFASATARAAADTAAKKAAGDVSFFKAAGLSSMLLNVKGSDGKATQQVNPVFQEVADNARLKTDNLMAGLKDKGMTVLKGLDLLKEGVVSTAIKGVNMLAEKPKTSGGGGISDVDSFNRDLQAGALNAERAAEETAKNTATAATLLGEMKALLSQGKLLAQAILP